MPPESGDCWDLPAGSRGYLATSGANQQERAGAPASGSGDDLPAMQEWPSKMVHWVTVNMFLPNFMMVLAGRCPRQEPGRA
jgi:hypothetical protein